MSGGQIGRHPLLPVVTFIERLVADIPCRVHAEELAKVPQFGPLIVIANHIGRMEVPAFLAYLYPRPVTGMAKIEAFRNPLYKLLYWTYRAIPVRRGEADIYAMNLSLDRLKEGYILAISPEGTRSYNGRLQRAHPGLVLLAVKSGAPVLPMAHFGGEMLPKNLPHFRRTDLYMRIGDPFTVDTGGARLNKESSQVIVDEIMYQMAAILPPYYRGVYSDLQNATEKFLRFAPGAESNLKRAPEMDRFMPVHPFEDHG
jgi:1-acyl-sn-glycerol-3-phosphate acyltransferase